MNKIIILGCGYIGTNLANFIKCNFNDDIYVVGIANEYNEYLNAEIEFIPLRIEQISEADKELFKDAIVIDAVGNINAANSSFNSSTIFLQNCTNKIELIQKLISLKVKKYIFLSSGGTIYNDSPLPHKEEENSEPKSVYALEKMIIENYLKINSLENNNLDYLILRLSNPYGGIVSKLKTQGIIDVSIAKLEKKEEISFFGDLDNIRDYIYIDNLIDYIYKIAISDCKNDIFNIGLGVGYSVNDVFNIIEKVYQNKIEFKMEKRNLVNIKCNILDVEKIKKYVKIDRIYSLEDGIRLIKEK